MEELSVMISPPFGINLVVIHGIRGRGTLSDVKKGSAMVQRLLDENPA